MRFSFFFMSLGLALSLVFASAIPAQAASKKELETLITQLEQRLSVLENRMLTGDPAAERLMQRMDALETANRAMTGEVERLVYERDTLQEEVRTLAGQITTLQTTAEDMRRHLKAVNKVAKEREQRTSPKTYGGEASSTLPQSNQPQISAQHPSYKGAGGVYSSGSILPPPPTIGGLTPPAGAGNDMSQLAKIGQDKLDEGDFAGAQSAFKQYLDLNPDAKNRGDVFFWLGETYYARSGFSQAADAYIASMRAAPKGDYAPEAMVKLASTARALGKTDMACQTLASFPSQYPKAVPAVREKARVESGRSGC